MHAIVTAAFRLAEQATLKAHCLVLHCAIRASVRTKSDESSHLLDQRLPEGVLAALSVKL
jgi:hypothetical protein